MEVLREIRRQKGWSQKDLADESGVGQDTISGIESGRHEPRPSTLRKLAKALDIEIRELFEEPALLGKNEASKKSGLKETTATELEVPFMMRPQVREWLVENGHVTRGGFLSYVEGLGPDELDITKDGWPRGLENALVELRRKRDSLQQELRKPSTYNALFPAQMQGLIVQEERDREALRPGRDAWKLAEEIRREYSARERTLMAYGRWLHYQGITSGHLVYAPLVENERRRMLEAALTEAS